MATSRKIALLFAAENVNAIIGWIALLFVARKMGASAIGEFSFALSLVGYLRLLLFLVLKWLTLRELVKDLIWVSVSGLFFR